MSTTAAAFKQSATEYCRDLDHRQRIRKALTGYEAKRDENKARFQSWEDARQVAAEIKFEVINHLDQYLERFEKNLKARGVQVHWASDGKEAREIIVRIAQENQVRHIIKSKRMTSEEIHLNEALEKNGFDVFESDLGGTQNMPGRVERNADAVVIEMLAVSHRPNVGLLSEPGA